MGKQDSSKAFVSGFYEANRKTVQPHLFDTRAQEIANCLWGEKPSIDKKTGEQKRDKQGKPLFDYFGVSSTQLRRFFDEVKRYDRLLGMQNQSWEEQAPYIRMLKSKVAYSVARVKKEVTSHTIKNLSEFINSCIDCVKSEKDYHIFTSLFEAVYGFYYELAPKD